MFVKMFILNSNGISFNLPETILQEIQDIPLATNLDLKDKLVWAFLEDGLFSLKSAYLITKDLNPLNPDTHPCQWVLEMNTTPRIKFFLWLCSQNSIPTREVLGSRGFNLDTMCEVCERAFESITHVLRDCLEVSNVWKGLGIRDTNQVFYGLPLMDWLKSNCSSFDFFFHRPWIPWKMLFPHVICLIWLQRNKIIFQSGKVDPNTYAHYIKKGAEFFAIVPNSLKKPRRIQVQVAWNKPQSEWVNINSDGFVFGFNNIVQL